MTAEDLIREGNRHLQQALRLVRWRDWATSKLPFVAEAYLLLCLTQGKDTLTPGCALRILLFAGCYLAFGYVFNDWVDRDADLRVGKASIVGGWRPGWAAGMLLGLAGASFLSLGPLLQQSAALVLVALSYGLALAYSMPVIRLKERGLLGLLSAGLAQRTMPAALVFAVASRTPLIPALVYVTLISVVGLRWMVAHQLVDHANDVTTATRTFVVHMGYAGALRWLPRMVAAELVLGSGLVLLVALQRPAILAVPVIYVLASAVLTKSTGESFWQMLADPGKAYLVLADWYFIYWPLGLTLVGMGVLPGALLWAAGWLVWQWGYVRQHLRNLWGALTRKRAPRNAD